MPKKHTEKQQPMSHPLLNPWKRRWYFLTNLPSLWFWGVRVEAVQSDHCVIYLPHNWRSKNPFRSIYFSALCGAGELASGVLAQTKCQSNNVSMLVTEMEAKFHKKAVGGIRFRCDEGLRIAASVDQAVASRAPQTCRVKVSGESAGQIAVELWVTWSFRARTK